MFLEKFYSESGVDGEDMCVEYVEAHAMGHPEADRDEVEALATLAGNNMEGPLHIGSVKPATGHLLAASCKTVCQFLIYNSFFPSNIFTFSKYIGIHMAMGSF